MIARRLRMNSEAKSSILRLVEYLLDEQQANCRVGTVRITGCESEDLQWAALEMLATQNQNTRAKGDKTYHLLLSFHEHLDANTLRQIEDEICKGLGFEGHQRVSVLHGDTDNPHLHIAINKIHPQRLTMHEPFYDELKLATLCERMEQKYGLKPDNHVPEAEAKETKAVNMEKAGDLESLIGWIQRNCLEELKKADSWQQLHEILEKNGLSIKRQNNGLTIKSGTLHVKASSVDRALSKSRLEKRLGPFEASKNKAGEQQPSYQTRPMQHEGFNSSGLWEQYNQQLAQNDEERRQALQHARENRDAELEEVHKASDIRSMFIKNFTSGTILKRILYRMNRRRLRKKAESIKAKYKQSREKLKKNNQRETWNVWLTKQAAAGNSEALAALRARGSDKDLPGNRITGSKRHEVTRDVPLDKVTNQGTKIYSDGLRLSKNYLIFPQKSDDETIKNGLELAMRRFGSELDIPGGSDDFRANVVRVAAENKIPVRFKDWRMDMQRRALSSVENAHSAQRR